MKTKRMHIFFIFLLITMLVFSSCTPETENAKQEPEVDFSGAKNVCKLATLKCYYHNVAKAESEASGLFKALGVGYKKLWIEYSGIVELGVDAAKVTVSKPDENGIVKVSVPKAEIISIDLDPNSLNTTLKDQGFLTTITKEEETMTLANAQQNMEESANENKFLLLQARDRAKQVLKGYIINVGKQIGKSYTIEWVD